MAFFNRRYATGDLCNSGYPALKDRAKLITTLRVGQIWRELRKTE